MNRANDLRRVLLLGIMLLAFGLRLWRLDAEELRGDEVFGYSLSLQPLGEIIESTLELQEPHPVASYAVAHVWLGWAGYGEFALRYPGVWFGMLAVALAKLLARKLEMGAEAEIAAALWVAISPYTIWHSQDARMYAMSMALTLASSVAAWVWLQGQSRKAAVVYLLVTWLALHTHYYAVFIVAGQSFFLFLDALLLSRNWVRFWRWVGVQAILLLLFAPWLFVARHILSGYHGNGGSPGLVQALVRTTSAFVAGEAARMEERGWIALVAGIAFAAGGVGLWRLGKPGQRAALFLVCYAAVPVIATWLSALNRPIFDERYLMAAAPPFYLLAAFMVSGLRIANSRVFLQRGLQWVGAGLCFVLLLVSILGLVRYRTDPSLSKTRGWRELAQVVEQLSAGVDANQVRIVQNYPDPTLWYYYSGTVEHLVLPPSALNVEGAAAHVEALVAADVRRVILTVQPSPTWDGESIAQAALADAYRLVREMTVANWMVEVYVDAPQSLEALQVNFANGVALEGFATSPQGLMPGGLLVVHLGWAGPQPDSIEQLSGSDTVFVQLLDANGVLVAQQDRPLVSGGGLAVESPQSYGILLPSSLVAGKYRLIAGLYDPQKPGAPRILTSEGSDHVLLAELSILQP